MKRGSAGRLKLLYVLSVACLTACAADPFGIAIPPTERVPSAPECNADLENFCIQREWTSRR